MVVLFSVIKMFAWTCQPLQMRLPCCLITMQTNDPVTWSHIAEEQRPQPHWCKCL